MRTNTTVAVLALSVVLVGCAPTAGAPARGTGPATTPSTSTTPPGSPAPSTEATTPAAAPLEAPVEVPAEPVDEAWLRAVLTWQAGDQSWEHASQRGAALVAADAYVEVLAGAILDAAVQDVTARHGTSTVTEIRDVTDPQAYPPGSGARVLAARVEFTGGGGWSRPALLVVAELHTAGDQLSAVLIGDGAVSTDPAQVTP